LEKSLLFLKVAGFFGAKKVGQLHGGAFIDFWKELGPIRKKITLKELNRLDILIVASHNWQKILQENCGIKTKIRIISNPIDKIFEKEAIKFKKHEGNTILFVGRIDTEKGVLDIIEAANLLKNRINKEFIFAGSATKRNDLNKFKNLVHKYNLENEINLKGMVIGKEKINLFRQASIFLLPSYIENFPLVIIEAAAAGLPIIATLVGALTDFFKHNESIMFIESGNINQLAKAIEVLINDKAKREKLARGAREVFSTKLSRQEIMFSLDKAYQEILTK